MRHRKLFMEDPLLMYDRTGASLGHGLRNLWGLGNAGFLVCGGPSLKEIPYHRLAERGIVSLGVNNVAGMAPVRAFCCSDPPIKFHHGIWMDPAIMKLVPVPKLKRHIRVKLGPDNFEQAGRVRSYPNVFGFKRICEYKPEEFLTSDGATWGNNAKGVVATGGPKILFTFFCALRLMHYLGIRKLFLLGVDFTMNEGGRYVGAYAFPQAGHGSGNNNHYRVALDLLAQTKPYFDAAGFEIYNCNPESHLTLWPYISFKKAMRICRGNVPPEPFDLGGWYEKTGNKDQEDVRTDSIPSPASPGAEQ